MANDYTPSRIEVRCRYQEWAGGSSSDQEREAEFDRWLAAHDAEKRAEWEAEQGWEYAIGAEYEDRPGKFWRDHEWSTTTELSEALDDRDSALSVFANARVLRRRPSTPWVPVNENGSER